MSQPIEALIAILRARSVITPLEKDILDTWDALNTTPFDDNSAQRQIKSNDFNHPDVTIAVEAKPTTIKKPPENITRADLIYILQSQFELLIAKEYHEVSNQN